MQHRPFRFLLSQQSIKVLVITTSAIDYRFKLAHQALLLIRKYVNTNEISLKHFAIYMCAITIHFVSDSNPAQSGRVLVTTARRTEWELLQLFANFRQGRH